MEDSRNVGVFASGFASSPGSFFRRRWLRGGRRRSDGDFASESALVVDLIRSGSATRGFVNVWWFVVAAWFRETSAGSGFVAAEVARDGGDLVRDGGFASGNLIFQALFLAVNGCGLL